MNVNVHSPRYEKTVGQIVGHTRSGGNAVLELVLHGKGRWRSLT